MIKDLTIGGFVMRKLEEIERDIRETRDKLHKLYEEQRQLAVKDISIDVNKLYTFRDPADSDVVYFGKIYDYWVDLSDGEYMFNVTGFQKCHSEYRDSCWSSFDAKYQLSIRPDRLKDFMDTFVELTPEQFENEFTTWLEETKKWLDYWLSDE